MELEVHPDTGLWYESGTSRRRSFPQVEFHTALHRAGRPCTLCHSCKDRANASWSSQYPDGCEPLSPLDLLLSRGELEWAIGHLCHDGPFVQAIWVPSNPRNIEFEVRQLRAGGGVEEGQQKPQHI